MNERSARILDMVAASYIRTAKPVASARIAERLALSSATVRNEFAALADEGFLHQTHASSGRIPTVLGFHRYATRFLPPRPLPAGARQRLAERLWAHTGDGLLEHLASVAADMSGYAVVVTLPADDHLHAVEIHLSLVSGRTLLAVIVLENGLVRQLRVPLDPAPDDDVLDDAERSLRQLTLPLREVPGALRRLSRDTDPELARTLTAIAAAWPDVTPHRSAQAGLRHLFDEPEARDPDFVRLVVELIESPSEAAAADVEGPARAAEGVDTRAPATERVPSGPIGTVPVPHDQLVELALDEAVARVRSCFRLGASLGTLTVLGPARMRYWAAVRVAGGIAMALRDASADD
jgi:heat-inducible transcriptional repressor